MKLSEYLALENAKTQKEIARECGVSTSMINHLAQDKRRPSGRLAASIVASTGGLVALDDFFPVEKSPRQKARSSQGVSL